MRNITLGCGEKIKQGWTNIDVRDLPGVDIVHDLEEPLPFDDETVDTILAEDVLEHMSWRVTDDVFADWVRVLRPGGKICLIVPNIDAHIYMYHNGGDLRGMMGIEMLRCLIFGKQDYPENSHYTTFNPQSVQKLFIDNGLSCEVMLSKKGIIADGVKK